MTGGGIQNAQGGGVLSAAGHRPPANALTIATGLGSMPVATLGAVPVCVTGPANALLSASGATRRHWIGAVVFGALMAALGLFAPLATRAALALPAPFIAVLGGLAMLPVLRQTFQ